MSLATLDPHEVFLDLRSAGFTNEQAAAVARNLCKAHSPDKSTLAATLNLNERPNLSDDVRRVRDAIREARVAIGKDITKAKVDILECFFVAICFQTLMILGAAAALIEGVKS